MFQNYSFSYLPFNASLPLLQQQIWSIFPLAENFQKTDPEFTIKSSLNFAKTNKN